MPMLIDMPGMPFAAPHAFVPGVEPPEPLPERALWFVFQENRLLVGAATPQLPAQAALAGPVLRSLYLGRLAGANSAGGSAAGGNAAGARAADASAGDVHAFAAECAAAAEAPEGWRWSELRPLYGQLDDALFALAGRALQLIDWDRTHQFCGRCASPTRAATRERARRCPQCGLSAYPRLAPAVMALIRRLPDAVLLARSPRFAPGVYSALAGFAEPGETLEQCLHREVFEEVGLRVRNLRYVASQPWPFPHSLMVAFICDYESGQIQPDPHEIEAADWFRISALPQLPMRISIARRLIDAGVAEMAAAMR
jgi:NAD+ diphosphatase